MLRSVIHNEEGLDKVRPMTACDHNEWKATRIWPASRPARELEATTFPFFIHSVFAGLVPLFSDFLCAILDHYQIHLLHLQPNSIFLLAIFAYLCEAFLGVMPSVALWRCFYSLRITAGNQRSGCASFRIADGMAEKIINMRIAKKVEGFRTRWIYMDAKQFSPLFLIPTEPAVKSSGWEHDELRDARLAPLVERMQELKAAGLTGAMVAKEFIRRRIAPLQRRSRPVWMISGSEDPMRLSADSLRPEVMEEILKILFSEKVGHMAKEAFPLYRFTNRDDMIADMPSFDQ